MKKKGNPSVSTEGFLKWLSGQDLSLSKRKLQDKFRKETGQVIGREKANDLIGQALNKPKDLKKATRVSKKPPKVPKTKAPKTPKYQEPKDFFPMPHKDMYLDKKYAWVVGYRFKNKDGVVIKDEYGFSDYVTIISDRRLSKRAIFEQAADYIDTGMSDNSDNRYDDIKQWYPSTLTIVNKFYNPWKDLTE